MEEKEVIEIPVKNMVCHRCIKAVTGIFNDLNVKVSDVRLGVVELTEPLSPANEKLAREMLKREGFEWMDDQKLKLIEQVKKEIISLVHYSDLDAMKQNLSTYLSGKLNKDYHYLSTLFSSMENTTIEQYFILQKIERVKEWLVYNEFTLNEMAFKLGYSSVAHLSSQFKKITGFTPSAFKNLKVHHRKPLDEL